MKILSNENFEFDKAGRLWYPYAIENGIRNRADDMETGANPVRYRHCKREPPFLMSLEGFSGRQRAGGELKSGYFRCSGKDT